MNYLIIFIEGLASFISPCILPLLPMYISYFAGQDKEMKKSILNSIGFVIGFTIVFVLLGVFTSSIGNLVSEYSKYINLVLGIIVILFGLNYLGVLKIKLLNKSNGIKKMKTDLSFIQTIFFGMIFSICWTPCVGVFLSTALAMSATAENVVEGGLLLLTFSMGLGIPFVITAIFLEKLKTTFDFIKKNYKIINRISGAILIITGILIMFNLTNMIGA